MSCQTTRIAVEFSRHKFNNGIYPKVEMPT